MMTDPKMPEQPRKVSAAPPFAVFDELGKGCDDEVADHVRAYAEALAAARVAKERERWATAARLCVQATTEQLPMALDALADALQAQPPETGKEK